MLLPFVLGWSQEVQCHRSALHCKRRRARLWKYEKCNLNTQLQQINNSLLTNIQQHTANIQRHKQTVTLLFIKAFHGLFVIKQYQKYLELRRQQWWEGELSETYASWLTFSPEITHNRLLEKQVDNTGAKIRVTWVLHGQKNINNTQWMDTQVFIKTPLHFIHRFRNRRSLTSLGAPMRRWGGRVCLLYGLKWTLWYAVVRPL